jgi:hypothetical protein
MKAPILMILVVSTAGCATLGTAPGPQVSAGSTVAAAGIDFAPAMSASPFPDQNIGPRIIMPVTGGAPIIGIPLGGDMYLPVTGGAPIIGMPTTP